MIETVLKEYLEEAVKTDAALSAKYDASRIADCVKYVKAQAKKCAENGCAMVEDSIVYKWARDFYYGDIEQAEAETAGGNSPEEEEPEEEITGAAELQAKPVTVVTQKKPAEKKKQPEQFSLFDFGA